ncbi:MAG: hypothetical protein K6B46_05095 [Opitutales bacterium]|nr:hypothetical protein [Opitutales bacterium]
MTLITRETGIRVCLVRYAVGGRQKKPAKTCVPDLFDKVELVLPSAKAGIATDLLVAKEYNVLEKMRGIGNYDSLFYASNWAFLLAKNQYPADLSETVYDLAERILIFFASKPLPQAIYFKGLWLLVKTMGYPVKEDWFENLAYDEREAAQEILTTPLDELKIDSRMLRHLVVRLERWLTYSHQFRFNGDGGKD